MKIARLLVALLPVLPAMSQEPVPATTEISFERVTRASKESLRDSAELPMRMSVDFSATDLNGKVRKHGTTKFDYDFHGFNRRFGNTNLRGPGSGRKEALTIAAAAMLPAVLVATGVERSLKMKAIDSPQAGIFAAELVPEKDSLLPIHVAVTTGKPVPHDSSGSGEKCQTFGWAREAYLFENVCLARAQVQLQREDLSIKTFAFDAGGLPQHAEIGYLRGEANITAYHVDIDFQKATLPGDPKPFVVPRHVTVNIVTDKGTLMMAAEFALKK